MFLQYSIIRLNELLTIADRNSVEADPTPIHPSTLSPMLSNTSNGTITLYTQKEESILKSARRTSRKHAMTSTYPQTGAINPMGKRRRKSSIKRKPVWNWPATVCSETSSVSTLSWVKMRNEETWAM